MADRRLDPLDEIQRLWMLLTAAERVRFLAWLTTSPDVQQRPIAKPPDPSR